MTTTNILLKASQPDRPARWHRWDIRSHRSTYWSERALLLAASVIEERFHAIIAINFWFRDIGELADVVSLATRKYGWNSK